MSRFYFNLIYINKSTKEKGKERKMYCEHCGKKVEECICEKKDTIINEEKTKKGNFKFEPWMVGVFAVLLVLVIATLFTSGGEKIDLKAFINTRPEIHGLNGKARIEISELFDSSSLESALLEGLEKTDSSNAENMSEDDLEALFAEVGEGFLACEEAMNDIEVKVWKNGVEVEELCELSNGDKIKVEASSKNPVNSVLDVKFKTGSAEFTIEGLTDGEAVDIFSLVEMEVQFFGTDGNGKAQLDWDSEVLSELDFDFHMEKGTELCNEDEVKVILDYDTETWEDAGYYPTEEYKIYIVDGLNKLVSTESDISEEMLNTMKAEVENALKEEAKSEWRDGISIENMTYLGSYFLNKKQGNMSLGASNIIYLVYKVDVFENFAPNGGEDTHFSYYYYGSFEGLQMDQDGNVDLEIAYRDECWNGFYRRVCMGTSFIESDVLVNYNGYETLADLYEDCVEEYSDQYDYESTVKE